MQRLLARQEPLIDLAIASYCDNAEVLETLWQSGDETIKVAIATNTFRRGFAGLPTTTLEEVCSDPALVARCVRKPFDGARRPGEFFRALRGLQIVIRRRLAWGSVLRAA